MGEERDVRGYCGVANRFCSAWAANWTVFTVRVGGVGDEDGEDG